MNDETWTEIRMNLEQRVGFRVSSSVIPYDHLRRMKESHRDVVLYGSLPVGLSMLYYDLLGRRNVSTFDDLAKGMRELGYVRDGRIEPNSRNRKMVSTTRLYGLRRRRR